MSLRHAIIGFTGSAAARATSSIAASFVGSSIAMYSVSPCFLTRRRKMGTRQNLSAVSRETRLRSERENSTWYSDTHGTESWRDQGLGELDLAHQAELDQKLPELSPVFPLSEEGLFELGLR